MKIRQAKMNPDNGFTLVELLVVIAIIGLLTAFASTHLFTSQEEAKAVACKAQLKDRGIQFTQATQDLYNTGPTSGRRTRVITLPCGCKIEVPIGGGDPVAPVTLDGCPKAPSNPLFAEVGGDEPRTLSYGMVNLAQVDMSELEPYARWLLACSDFKSISEFDEIAFERHRDSVNVFFYDGHVDRMPLDLMPFPGRDTPGSNPE